MRMGRIIRGLSTIIGHKCIWCIMSRVLLLSRWQRRDLQMLDGSIQICPHWRTDRSLKSHLINQGGPAYIGDVDVLTLARVSRGLRRVSLFLFRLLTCSTTREKWDMALSPSFACSESSTSWKQRCLWLKFHFKPRECIWSKIIKCFDNSMGFKLW